MKISNMLKKEKHEGDARDIAEEKTKENFEESIEEELEKIENDFEERLMSLTFQYGEAVVREVMLNKIMESTGKLFKRTDDFKMIDFLLGSKSFLKGEEE